MEDEESVAVQTHLPCDECGSSDAASLYSDGHTHCFSCGHHTAAGSGEVTEGPRRKAEGLLPFRGYSALRARSISEETCKKFGYSMGEMRGKPCQVAPYYDDEGNLVAQKVRFANKTFKFLGDTKQATLFGQRLWSKGKMIVVTEGEIDAMSVSQLQGNKWPVVSIKNGAQGAHKCLASALDYLLQFDTIILMFDSDEPGREAAQKCAPLFPIGRVKIATLPGKDPNALLVEGRGNEVVNAIWQAQPWRPDGIVSGTDLWEDILADDATVESIPYPWPKLNTLTHGMRRGELVTLTAGTGVGKSTAAREITHHLVRLGETVGILALEESVKRTALGLMSIELNRPLHLSREGVTEEDLRSAFDATAGSGKVFLLDHFGSTEVDNILNRVRYMAVALGCRWVILDHLSIVVSGLGDGDERKLIDRAMTALRTLVEETGIGLVVVSHLKRPEGKGHEEGAQTSLSQLRGSAAIGQLSDLVLGFERDQQSDNPCVATIRVLKNRFSGECGVGAWVRYDQVTGRLLSCDEPEGKSPFKPVEADEFEDEAAF